MWVEVVCVPIDYNYVIRVRETMIIDWQCIAFPCQSRSVRLLIYGYSKEYSEVKTER